MALTAVGPVTRRQPARLPQPRRSVRMGRTRKTRRGMVRLFALLALLAGQLVFMQPSKAAFVLTCDGHKVTVGFTVIDSATGQMIPGPTDGADTIIGTAGRDVIQGLGGDDLIIGSDGDDILCGGPGE